MTLSHALALVLIPVMLVATAVLATWSARVRDALFVGMICFSVFAERLQVNFFSQAWYRGTTRGLQITLIEILAFGLLVGCWLGRPREERRWFWPASLGIMLFYFAYCVVSVVVSDPKVFGAYELSKMFGAVLIFLAAAAYVRTQREWTILLVAVGCTVAFEGVWAVKQRVITQLDRVAGTLDHANSLSMYLCMTVPLLVAAAFAGWSPWLRRGCAVAAGLGTVGVLLTFSRAGIPVLGVAVLGAIVTCASWKMTTSRLIVRSLLVLAAVALMAALAPKMQERYAAASLQEEYLDATVDGRGIYLRLAKMLATDHFFGVGLNNWSYHVSRSYGAQLGFRFMDYDYLTSVYGTEDDELFANSYLAAPAHNLAALTLGELGLPGLVIFALLWARWFGMGAAFLWLPRTEPLRVMGVGLFFAICGIFGQSLTEWVYRQTPILSTFYILLGALASLTAVRRRAKAEVRAAVALSGAGVAGRPELLVAERV